MTETERAFEREHCFRQLWEWAYFREHHYGDDMSRVRALLSVATITDSQVDALLAIRFGSADEAGLPLETAEPLQYPRPLPGCLKDHRLGWHDAFVERDALCAEVERLKLRIAVLELAQEHARGAHATNCMVAATRKADK